MADPIRILIADDHPIVRDGLRTVLERSRGIHIVGEASDGQQALALAIEHAPDIALLDMEMPGHSGFEVARAIRQTGQSTRVIFLTLYKDRDFFEAALEVGANGYLLKEDPPETVLDAIHAVASGRRYFSPALTLMLAAMAPVNQVGIEERFDALTPTEKRILRLIGMGKTSKEIGAELSLHYRTIENNRTQICRKLDLAGPHALLRFAMQQAQLPEIPSEAHLRIRKH
ncbi:response regulator [Silvibacterium sp.]|uniref:response regulator n=1 Tax=Silvibacterium sp. TaxID=1964179 RepID=UPI0039E255C4